MFQLINIHLDQNKHSCFLSREKAVQFSGSLCTVQLLFWKVVILLL